MRVAIVSDAEVDGGAAVAASRLALGLVDAGCEVVRVVGQPAQTPSSAWKTVLLPGLPRRPLPRRALRRALPQVVAGWDRADLVARVAALLADIRPDAINLHNIHFTRLPTEVAAACLGVAPTVWTLHDMWSFTGRCAYSYDCRKFVTGCDAACPTPTEYPALPPRLIRGEWERKRDVFRRGPQLAAVCPSRWLADEARAGLWAGHRVERIPYGLPLDVFSPIDRAFARQALDVPGGAPVLLVVAQNLSDRRKGGELFRAALSLVRRRPLTVMTLGERPVGVDEPGIRSVHLGYVTNDRLKALAYSAADLFVHPAPVDNLPNVLLEALACGTPAVGFPIGGVPDIIRPPDTGWLAADLTPAALAAAIDTALAELAAGDDRRAACRAQAEREYAIPVQAARYLDLFRSLRAADARASLPVVSSA